MFHGKPIIGLAGGIGSGKSFVGQIAGSLGWCVINSDELSKKVYDDGKVRQTLSSWWGSAVIAADGNIDRSAVARIIFTSKDERQRLESLVHPAVAATREQMMNQALSQPELSGFIWDSPLLFESGLNSQCDSVIFIDAPLEVRQSRVARTRGWTAQELVRREKSQLPLDIKRKMSHDVVRSTSEATEVRAQVEEVLSRISERFKVRTIRPASAS